MSLRANFQSVLIPLFVLVLCLMVVTTHLEQGESYIIRSEQLTEPQVCVIYNEPEDLQILSEVSSWEEQFQFVKLNTSLNDQLSVLNLSHYSFLLLLLDNATLMKTQLLELQTAVDNGLTVMIQTSQLWKLDNEQLLGLKPLNQTIRAEWSGKTELVIVNNTYFANVTQGDTFELSGKGTFAIELNEDINTLVDVYEEQFISSDKHLGIFEYNYGAGTVFTVNIAMFKNNHFIQTLLKQLVRSIMSPLFESSEPSTPSDNPVNMAIPPEVIGLSALAIAGTAAAIGAKSYINKDEREILSGTQPSDNQIDQSTSDYSLGYLLVAPIVFLLHGMLHPLRKLSQEDVYDNPTRRQVIEILETTKFEHFRELKRLTDSGVGALTWHLRVLEDFEIIDVRRYGQYKLFQLSDTRPTRKEIEVYFALRTEMAQQVVKYFRKNINKKVTISKLERDLNINKDTLHYHCSKFVGKKILLVDDKSYWLNQLYLEDINTALEHIEHNKYYQPNGF